ncbi:MAG TPA: hypothetical protein VFE13_01130 [Caulobacteraceae bacterium]|nr:hypothetical protein [Caulobacteraceae bacterium]
MTLFDWKGGSGNLGLATNWRDQDNQSASLVPGADDAALIDATGTLTGSLDVAAATLLGDIKLSGQLTTGTSLLASGALTVLGPMSKWNAGALQIGSNGSASLTLASRGAIVASTLELGTGSGTSGAITINSAGTLTATAIWVGGQPGSTGSISISGAGSKLNDDGLVSIGTEGDGVLSITAGGALTDTDTGDGVTLGDRSQVEGAVRVSGKGSKLTACGYLLVGDVGAGMVTVSGGGALSISAAHGTNFQQGIDIGVRAGASGKITVTGAGSTITDVGYLTVGNLGSGSLVLTDGAVVKVTSAIGVELGQQTGGSGAVTVSGGAALIATAGGISLGNGAGTASSALVTGAGSAISSNGYLGVGAYGQGTLTIAAGASVSDSNLSVGIGAGAAAGGIGKIRVTGVGSTLTVASYIELGYAGFGSLTIGAGGAASIDGPAGNSTAVVLLGGVEGGVGSIKVDGAGSSLTADASFQIGYGGKGSLAATNGASVQLNGTGADTFAVGSVAGSSGSVFVSGAQSRLSSATGFRIGAGGEGQLTVTAGASMAATEYLVFGFAAGSRGLGTIANATVTVGEVGVAADGVLVGQNGFGHLAIGVGGVLADRDSAGVAAGSILTIAGGSFSSTVLTNEGHIDGFGAIHGGIVNNGLINGDNAAAALKINTMSAVVANTGRIKATGGGGVSITGDVTNTGVLAAVGGTLTVWGDVSGAGSVTIGGGTAHFAGSFSENVSFTGKTGVLELAHARGYAGQISGFSHSGAASLDLRDIAFVSASEATFSGDAHGGVLEVSDGKHTAKIKLVGDYTAAAFMAASDGTGGVIITDRAVSQLVAAAAATLHADGGSTANLRPTQPTAALLAHPRS